MGTEAYLRDALPGEELALEDAILQHLIGLFRQICARQWEIGLGPHSSSTHPRSLPSPSASEPIGPLSFSPVLESLRLGVPTGPLSPRTGLVTCKTLHFSRLSIGLPSPQFDDTCHAFPGHL